jgi:hypothetical protein
MKNSMKILIAAMFSFVFIIPVIGAAAPIFPESLHDNGIKNEVVYKIGGHVYLFHSGAKEVRNTIRIHDVLTVYRESPCCNLTETGKIKVLDFTGDNHIKAEVVEGVIRHGDIAKRGTVSCLVLAAGCDCK